MSSKKERMSRQLAIEFFGQASRASAVVTGVGAIMRCKEINAIISKGKHESTYLKSPQHYKILQHIKPNIAQPLKTRGHTGIGKTGVRIVTHFDLLHHIALQVTF